MSGILLQLLKTLIGEKSISILLTLDTILNLKKMISRKMTKEEKMWQVRNDLDTIRRADEIRADKKRFAAVQKEAQAQIKSIGSVVKKK
jgi:hypothetical protein